MRAFGHIAFDGARSRLVARAAAALLLIALTAVSFSCENRHKGKKIDSKQTINKPAVVSTPRHSLLTGTAYSVLGPEVLGPLSGNVELKALRTRGIMKVAAPCGRDGMCMRMNYGAAVGFEVELLRRIANEGFGVKENIVRSDDETADIRAAVGCGAAGGPPDTRASQSGNPLAGPYFYSESSGWLCFEIMRGGKPVADALDRIISHFYNTGTFQQVYRNWFPPETPDAVRRK